MKPLDVIEMEVPLYKVTRLFVLRFLKFYGLKSLKYMA